MTRTAKAAICALLLTVACSATPQPPARSTIFVFHADELWLNLHHFLYVLGQAQGRDPSTLREAVRDAPAESERGLAALTADERATWSSAPSAGSSAR